jgi:hypothetical protein
LLRATRSSDIEQAWPDELLQNSPFMAKARLFHGPNLLTFDTSSDLPRQHGFSLLYNALLMAVPCTVEQCDLSFTVFVPEHKFEEEGVRPLTMIDAGRAKRGRLLLLVDARDHTRAPELAEPRRADVRVGQQHS